MLNGLNQVKGFELESKWRKQRKHTHHLEEIFQKKV